VTLHSIADAVISTDELGLINYINPVAEKLTGWPAREAVGKPLQDVFMIEELPGDIAMALPRDAAQQELGQRLLRHRHGGLTTINHTSAPIRTAEGRELGTVVVFQDISPMRDMERELAYHASHDALTGLINRREFELRLGKALESAQSEKVPHVLLYLDLDQFKVVNDTSGHRAGDELLRQLSKILTDALRRTDTLARLGGDEFGVLLESCPLDVGMRIAEGLRGLVKEFRFFWDNKTFDVGASIGVVPILDDGSSAGDLLSAADIACYAAKDLGRNRIHVYEPQNADLARRQGEMQWITRVTHALEEDRLRLFFQEIARVNGDGHMPRHIEVLLRMEDEQGKLVPPNAFLPAAERYNLMPTLDRWVIANAFDWYRDHGEDGLVCAINLSGTSLNDVGLRHFIGEQFQRAGIRPEAICFEITETAAVANLGAASELIQELRTAGSQFALDDFGSGLSSFAYLKNLPVDFLKIDGEFVRDIASDPVDRAMVAAIHTLAQVMGKQTIAEFVESPAILEELGRIGVDFAQGYAIGKPAPLDGHLSLVGQVTTATAAAQA
jgi:diguanylate cyclase (GGDEF)-like protein/PAS domain S-box-containing protein